MFSAPVPCSSTFAATVPTSGLRATTMGSWAGFSAVPKPDHFFAASVAGAGGVYPFTGGLGRFASVRPATVKPFPSCLSAPAALSIALLTSSDLGNPLPYSQWIESRISNPASSMATVIQ